MKLYCVRVCWPYEYNDIRAIFATRQEAEAHAEGLKSDPNTCRYDVISIEERELGTPFE